MNEFMLRELLNAFVIVSICVIIHAGGIVVFARFLSRRFSPAEVTTVSRQSLLLILVFAMVISLHLVETGVWAWFYFWNNLFPDFETALYLSLGTY